MSLNIIKLMEVLEELTVTILVLNLRFIIQIKFTKMMYKDKYSINFKFKPIQN